jgi:hypothetical protein
MFLAKVHFNLTQIVNVFNYVSFWYFFNVTMKIHRWAPDHIFSFAGQNHEVEPTGFSAHSYYDILNNNGSHTLI